MKELNLEQMENLQGGLKVDAELACDVAVGAIGVIAGTLLGITTLGLSLVASYATTVWAYYGCKIATGQNV